jgi:hypothetical protein
MWKRVNGRPMTPEQERALRIAVIFLGVLIIGTIAAVAHFKPPLDWRTITILKSASRVQTYRLSSEFSENAKQFKPTDDRIHGYRIKAIGPVEGQPFASELRNILLSPQTYTKRNVMCMMDPGVAYRVRQGNETVEVLLCFHCGQLLILRKNQAGETLGSGYTLMAGDSYKRLLALSRRAFPNDAALDD